jgi:hypothetical protein
MSDFSSPKITVSSACISFTEALLACRASVVTVDLANAFGQDLYTWFQGQGAITNENAPIASRSVDLAITALKSNGGVTAEDSVALVQKTYLHYTGS